jgi:hypothetical protein
MGRPLYTNNAATYLAFGITNTATTMQVSANAGGLFPSPTGGDYFYVSLISLSGPIIEIVKCTARNGDIFTIERGQEGTSPLYWNTGDNVQLRITAAGMNFIAGEQQDILAELAAPNGSSLIGYNEGCSGAINQTVQSKLQQFLDVKDFDNFSDAISCASSGSVKTLVLSSTVVGDGITIPAGVNLVVKEGGLITISATTTFTINGILTAGNYQIFSIPSNSLGILFTGFVVFGTGSVEYVTPTWWGADNTVGNYLHNTAAVQTAINTQLPVTFTGNYTIDNVILSNTGQEVRFNGFTLTGGSNYGAAYVLKINANFLSLYDVNINVNFNSYGCAVIWQSDSTHIAQFNRIYGLTISNALNGLVFGNFISIPSFNTAQSENTIYGFTVRAVQVPFTGNQTNGFLTLVAPILDCNPYEWATQPGYNATTWNTAAYALRNVEGVLVILSGEILKTTSQLGFGCELSNVYMTDVTIEIASTQANILGEVTINNNLDGFFGNDSSPLFVFDNSASGATLKIIDGSFIRPDGTGLYSGAPIFSGTPTGPCIVNIRNTTFKNWAASALLASGASNISIQSQQTIFNNYTAGGVLSTSTTPANYIKATTSAIASAGTIVAENPIFHVSGTTTIQQINLPYVGFTGSIIIIPDGVFALSTAGGNIGLNTNAVVGKALTLTYDGAKWWPSY